MVEAWFIELLKGIGMLFLNPLLYWLFVLLFFAGYFRIKRDRLDFGVKVFGLFSEWKNTWGISLISGFILSLIMLGVGFVFSYETILLLSVVTIILSISMRFSMLSPSYTIGITFILLLFFPLILENQSYIDSSLFSIVNFSSLVILLGLLLFVEAILIRNIKRNKTFPSLVLGNRGLWIGQHRLKKIGIIPFFILVPTGMITSFAPFWPYFSVGGESFSVLLVPFVLGFDFIVRGSLPQNAAKKLAKSITILGILVVLIGVGSLYLPSMALVAVIIAIFGREWIHYRYRVNDRAGMSYFHPEDNGLKILGIIPGTPAERLDILVGETIIKVNGIKINSEQDFYSALQSSGAYFKLEVVDDANEMRFVQGAFYQGDHHELGLIFTAKPFREKSKRKNIS
ncbi:PDZ domain-containing protein [Oceanobacillus chungangensis]|uniref:PDZ domain-containing protein n=1 Tax=Oceanobacillus chungangensis TaxID=1229152 RepID=A0A3D8PKC6_9BACI|nr:PDZ domain-containing protein [Oceanobacillus chungangensis]RDW15681.1 PDZ domain-containing protein [Oceanobacillus chungangensis]